MNSFRIGTIVLGTANLELALNHFRLRARVVVP